VAGGGRGRSRGTEHSSTEAGQDWISESSPGTEQ